VNNIAPINKGIQVLEKGTNFLSGVFLRWLQSVESRLNRAVVTDENGNVAYGSATIPSDVATGVTFVFNGSNCTFTSNSKSTISCVGCYLNNLGTYTSLVNGNITLLVESGTGVLDYYVKTAAVIGGTYDAVVDFTKTNIA